MFIPADKSAGSVGIGRTGRKRQVLHDAGKEEIDMMCLDPPYGPVFESFNAPPAVVVVTIVDGLEQKLVVDIYRAEEDSPVGHIDVKPAVGKAPPFAPWSHPCVPAMIADTVLMAPFRPGEPGGNLSRAYRKRRIMDDYACISLGTAGDPPVHILLTHESSIILKNAFEGIQMDYHASDDKRFLEEGTFLGIEP